MTKLEVLISTCGSLERASKMILPKIDGIRYIISCQSAPCPIHSSLNRDDISIFFTPTTGLSNNRNNALLHSSAPYVLIADDDLIYYSDGLKKIIQTLEENPDVDIALFMFDGEKKKKYPERVWNLSNPYKNYNVSSIEIACRLSKLRKMEMQFNQHFGLGAPKLKSGEDSLFILNAKKKGLKLVFFPITICKHPDETTAIKRQTDSGVLMAEGAIIQLAYPYTSIPRVVLKAKRTRGNIIRNAYYLFGGLIYGLLHRKKLLR